MTSSDNDSNEPGSAGELMVLGLVDHADKLQRGTLAAQSALIEEARRLGSAQQSAGAAVERLQKEIERLQAAKADIERSARAGIAQAIREQAGSIREQTEAAFATPVRDIRQAAAQATANVAELKWLQVAMYILSGMVAGFMLCFLLVMRGQNHIEDRIDAIDQKMAVPRPAPSSPAPASQHGGHGKK